MADDDRPRADPVEPPRADRIHARMAAKKKAAKKKVARKRGRPSGFSRELGERILARIRNGTPPTVAAGAEGVALATFDRWRNNRNKSADLRWFSEAVTRCRAEFESEATGSITEASKAGDWRAAAWHLERQFEARYAAKIKVVREEEAGRLLEIAERVLAGKDFERLLGACAAADSATQASAESGEDGPTVH